MMANRFITTWAYKEGVFKTSRGKFIARVSAINTKALTTISKHDTEEEATTAYDNYYNNK